MSLLRLPKSEIGHSAFDAGLTAVGQLVDYCRQKAIYEADCRVREELSKARESMFRAASMKHQGVTVELARCKAKLCILQHQVATLPSALKCLFEPLLMDMENRISQMRKERQELANR